MKKDIPCTTPSKCRSCSAPVLWVTWASEKKMPIDTTPSPVGNVVVTHRQKENVLFVEKFDPALHENRKRYTSHFSTCPNADQHRKGK